jgi:hypothetical protein
MCLFVALVTSGRSGRAGTNWTSIVFAVGARECLIDAGFDIALRLTTHCRQLRDYEVA